MYNNWEAYYEMILDDFSFNKCDDEISAHYLNDKIEKFGKFNMSKIDLPGQCIVFGAGPSIKKHISLLKNRINLESYCLIAADGATMALLEENIIPDIIVTDLDGDINSIIQANKKKSVVYVHAHGDNMDKLEKYLDMLDKIVPTCQCKAYGNLENYGGFTDGDRAVHIAIYALNLKKIILAGMDFGNIITKYSRPNIKSDTAKADDFKQKKLIYAEKLINSIKKNNPQIEFINLNDSTWFP